MGSVAWWLQRPLLPHSRSPLFKNLGWRVFVLGLLRTRPLTIRRAPFARTIIGHLLKGHAGTQACRQAGTQARRHAGAQARRHAGTQARRQAGRLAGWQAGAQAGRRARRHACTPSEALRQGGRETGRQGGKEAGRQGCREAGRQGGREAGRQADRCRQTHRGGLVHRGTGREVFHGDQADQIEWWISRIIYT